MQENPSLPPFVCVVDDDPSVADSTRYLMESFGFRSKSFLSAREFLGSGCIDAASCLILDMRMPEADGLDLQNRLAQNGKRCPIVFVTAQASANEERRALEQGAVAVLRKPVSESLLFDAIQTALNRTSSASAGGTS